MAEARLAPTAQKTVDPLTDREHIRQMLKSKQKVTGGGDLPTINLPYHVDRYTVLDSEVECLVIAIPLDQSFGDLRIKEKRWDDKQSKWVNPTLGITVNAKCGADTPPMFKFRDLDGDVTLCQAKSGFTLNIGLVDRPQEAE